MNHFRKTAIASMLALASSSAGVAQATTLDDFLNDTTGNWTVYVLDASAAVVGQCSAFTFGDISNPIGACSYAGGMVTNGGFEDNDNAGAGGTFFLAGGDGVLGGDRIAGTIGIIKTGRNSFDITGFQVDPYLGTAGGTFKTTMATNGFAGASGTVADVTGDMSLDLTGRTGIAEFFVMSLGEQPWNLDTHGTTQPFCTPGTGVYELLTSGTDTAISCADGTNQFTVTGRPLGDNDDGFGQAGTDGILDAVLVSAGNVGDLWQFFDGTPYSEAFNIRVRPAAAPDAGPIIETGTIEPVCVQTSVNPIPGLGGNGSNFTMLKPTGEVFGGTNDIVWNWDEMTFNVDETDPVTPGTALMTMGSAANFKFFGYSWSAHHLRVYNNTTMSTRTLTFDSTCTVPQLEAGADCSGNPLPPGDVRDLVMTLEPGQIGVHMLFDWNTSINIDVINIYDVDALWSNPDGPGGLNEIWIGQNLLGADASQPIKYVSTDDNGDGKNGVPMPDGPFKDYYANFNLDPGGWCAPSSDPVAIGDTKISGCSMSPTPTKLAHHADWLLVLGFLATLGLYRRKLQRNKT